MEKLLEYELNGNALSKYGEKLQTTITEWLRDDNGLDVDVSVYSTREMGTIIIDCLREKDSKQTDILTRKLFDKLGIDYLVNDIENFFD